MSRAFELVTADGQRWEFNDPACPLRLQDDPDGIEGAEFQFDDQQNIGQLGVTYRARNDMPNYLTLRVHIGPVPAGDDAVELYQRWRDALGFGQLIHRFHAITDYGGTRFQDVRLASKLPKPAISQIRHSGYVFEEYTFRSDETPFRKKPSEKTFFAADFVGAKITSESVFPVWPHFTITGPITTPTIGLAGEAIPLPTIGAGQTWVIETDPDYFSIRDHTGTDRSWVLRYWHTQAPAVPAGRRKVDVPVTITGSGTTAATKVKVVLPQLFKGGV